MRRVDWLHLVRFEVPFEYQADFVFRHWTCIVHCFRFRICKHLASTFLVLSLPSCWVIASSISDVPLVWVELGEESQRENPSQDPDLAKRGERRASPLPRFGNQFSTSSVPPWCTQNITWKLLRNRENGRVECWLLICRPSLDFEASSSRYQSAFCCRWSSSSPR